MGGGNVCDGVEEWVPLGRVVHGSEKVAVEGVAAMSCGGGCRVVDFLKAGTRRGQCGADVWQDAAVGAERLGAAAEGTLGG